MTGKQEKIMIKDDDNFGDIVAKSPPRAHGIKKPARPTPAYEDEDEFGEFNQVAPSSIPMPEMDGDED